MLETVELVGVLSRVRPTSLTGRTPPSGASTGRWRQLEIALAPGDFAYVKNTVVCLRPRPPLTLRSSAGRPLPTRNAGL